MDNEDDFLFEESLDDISFTVSEPDDQPLSISIDICNGSPLNPKDFIGAHFNINSIRALGRLDQLNHISNILNLDYIIINESKLDETVPNNLIALDRFHEPIRKDRDINGGGCLVYVSKHLTFKRQQKFESVHADMKPTWSWYKRSENHPDYSQKMKDAIVSYNSQHVKN